jgi:hypothetical protein
MTRAIPTILVPLLAAAFLSAQDEKKPEVRRLDIRSLTNALTETTATFPFAASPVRAGGAGEASVHSLWGQRGEDERQDDVIPAIVRFALHCDAEPDACRELVSANDGWLQLSGPARFLDQGPRVLAELRRATATVQVEISVLPPEALASLSSAILDPAKADRLLEIAKPLASMRAHVRPGSQTLFEAVARRAYVKDYDTEVAQDAKGADPVIDVIAEGLRASVRVDRTPGGAFVLSVEGQQSELNGPMRAQVLTYTTPATLQLPRVWWSSTSASARVENRGAIVIGNDVAPRSAWMVRVIEPAPAKPADDVSLQILPIRAVARAGVRPRGPDFRSPNVSGMDASSVGEAAEEASPRINVDGLVEKIRALRPDVAPEERRVLQVGGFLVLDGNRAFVTEARDLVSKAVDDSTHALSVEVRAGTVAAAGFTAPGSDELEALAAMLPRHTFTAAMPGDRVVILAGETHAYLKDRDVEIAQTSTVSDPIVDTFFTGLSASCEAVPSDQGRCAIDFRLEYQELIEMSTIATGSSEVPEIELPRIAATVSDVSTEIPMGSWALLQSSPLEGTDRQLVVLIRINS